MNDATTIVSHKGRREWRPAVARRRPEARSLRTRLLVLLLVALAPAAALAQTPGEWTTTGSLATGHFKAAGVVLSDGRALVAGGRDASGNPGSTVEIYNPSTGLWSAGGSMLSARSAHTATLLPNGKVLFAGGDAAGTAELFDPALGSSVTVGSVPSTEGFHTATLLLDGRVLIAGGANATGALSTTRLYDPAAGPNGTLTDGPALTTARRNHTATRLSDGRVLIAGGRSGIACRRDAEVFDPSGDVMSPTGSMGTARCDHTATLLLDGRVLIVGGASIAGPLRLPLGFGSFEANASPGTDAFSLTNATGSFSLACSADFPVCTSVTLDGTLAVATTGGPVPVVVPSMGPGQLDFTGFPQLEFSHGEVVSAGFHGSLSPTTLDLFGGPTGVVFAPTFLTSIFPGVTDVAVVMGNPTLRTAEIYTPGAGAFTGTGALPGPRTLHTATLLPTGEVLIAGGTADEDSSWASAELFNAAELSGAGGFSTTAFMATGRWGAVALRLLDGRTLVAGGGFRAGLGEELSAQIYTQLPPAVATVLVSPLGTLATGAPIFTWLPVPGATEYLLWLDDSTGGLLRKTYTTAAAGCGTGTCAINPGLTLAPGAGQWWIVPANMFGSGPWSERGAFTVPGNALPAPAVLLSPAGAITTDVPAFTWSAVPGATKYLLWLDDSTGGRARTWYHAVQAGCAGGTGTCSVSPGIPLFGGPARWWLVTADASEKGPWSGPLEFVVPGGPRPGQAALIAPAGSIATNTPTFTWTKVADAVRYLLWVDDSTGGRIRRWVTEAEAGCAGGPGPCAFSPGVLLAAGDGRWWIVAATASVEGLWSERQDFTVPGSLPPARATPIAPAGALLTNTPTFRWTASQGATQYLLWVDDSTGGQLRRWYSAAEAGCATGTGECAVAPGLTLAAGAGQWWVVAGDSLGNGPFSEPSAFFVPGQ